MDSFLEFIRTDLFSIILLVVVIILLILYIVNNIKLSKIKREYKKFMEKIGHGKNIEDILEKHVDRINKAITKNEELETFCNKIDLDIKNCIQKIRYI